VVGPLAARYPAPTSLLRGRRTHEELPSPTFGADQHTVQGYKASPRPVRPELRYIKLVNSIKFHDSPVRLYLAVRLQPASIHFCGDYF
jgi:hypothetical protein